MNTQRNEYKPILSDHIDRECELLCQQLREDLVRCVSATGGHLASNLGLVELTVALHRVFDTSVDRLVFDVGHQCYPHKMLTGRLEAMSTLRQYGGIAGFPKPAESVHDAFIAGHASNSVAVAYGMAMARETLGEDYKVIALIGDGALSGGLAYEGLSNAGTCGKQLLVILNDNGMSIAPSVGAVSNHLAQQRMKPQYLSFKKNYRKFMHATAVGRGVYKVTHKAKQMFRQSLLPCSMFENMGFTYLGPVDGHDLNKLKQFLSYAKDLNEPVLLHVKTVKGKGYAPAEQNPDAFHGVSPFDPTLGTAKKGSGKNFSAVFGDKLMQLAREDRRVCAITAAMVGGTGLDGFAAAYPDRFFDVGIAEGCAVSMAAGMAKQGAIPVFAVYSTFLQRAYDMLIHDVAIDKLHVVLGVDRAGLVGEDGETHQGVFDVAFLDSVPGMRVLAPASYAELESMLERAVLRMDGPVAVRYPRGGEGAYQADSGESPAVCLRPGRDITMVSYGVEVNDLLAAADALSGEGIEAEIIKLNELTPLPTELVLESVRRTGVLIVAEDSIASAAVGQRLAAAVDVAGISAKTFLVNCGDRFVHHGAVSCLKAELGLDVQGIIKTAREVLHRG